MTNERRTELMRAMQGEPDDQALLFIIGWGAPEITCGELRELLTSPPAPSGWQPIESAPKEIESRESIYGYGRRFLAYPVWHEVARIRWWEAKNPSTGEVYGNFIDEDGNSVCPQVWMPLPLAPGQNAKDALPPVAEDSPAKCVIGEYCRRHQFIHGAEAEELRKRVEGLITGGDDIYDRRLQDVLDDVDARDSLAFVETRDPALCAECDGSVCECGHCECAHTFDDDPSGPGCTECKGCDGFNEPTMEADASPAQAPAVHVGQPCNACGGTGLVIEKLASAPSAPQPTEVITMTKAQLDAIVPPEILQSRTASQEEPTPANSTHTWSPDATGTACVVCGGYPGQHGADGGEVVVACDCGNRDTITLPLTAMPPCSGGCGRRMRIVGVYVGARA